MATQRKEGGPMTAHQQSKLNDLRGEYRAVTVREDSETRSIYIDAYDIAAPELCLQCGRDAEAHLPSAMAEGGHYFKVAAPVATYRISPSGFKQRVDPMGVAA